MLSHLLGSVTLSLLSCASCTDDTDSAPDTDEQKADNCTASPAGDPAMVLSSGPPSNLLIIGVDTLRKDHIETLAADGEVTAPFTSSLLAGSVVLDDHESCSNWTYVSMVCLLSGATGIELGWLPNLDNQGPPEALSLGIELLPTWLGRAGFTTAWIGATPWDTSSWQITPQFDFADDQTQTTAPGLVDQTLVQAAALMAEGSPWFLQLHLLDPHMPYSVTSEEAEAVAGDLEPLELPFSSTWVSTDLPGLWDSYDTETQDLILAWLDAYYRAEIRRTDAELERLWEGLDEMGALDDTLVVFWTDHGEQFFEHGELEHGANVFAEEVDTVAAFWNPGLVPGVWTEPTSHTDVVPAIFDLMGLDLPNAQPLSGEIPGTGASDRILYIHHGRGVDSIVSARRENAQLVYRWDGSLEYYLDGDEFSDRFDPTDAAILALWPCVEEQVHEMDALMLRSPTPETPGI